jgi:hypothetical protein
MGVITSTESAHPVGEGLDNWPRNLEMSPLGEPSTRKVVDETRRRDPSWSLNFGTKPMPPYFRLH